MGKIAQENTQQQIRDIIGDESFRTVRLSNNNRFDETVTSIRTSQMNYKPTWGISTLRYAIVNTGAGAASSELNGEFKLESGTANNGIASIRTLQRGQYQAGTIGQSGIGVRIPVNPTSTAYMEWGYTDFANNGFYLGVDVNGKYIAYISGGNSIKIYQQDWNEDKLDGKGKSGLVLNYSEGVVSQIDFVWYGYGDIDFIFYPFNPKTGNIEKVVTHHLKISNSASIIDPNQPLMFRTSNGASGTTNTVLYIGGHQFSVLDGNSIPKTRSVAQLVTNFTTDTSTNWQPLIAVRKKATFNGRVNSVNALVKSFVVAANDEMEVRITAGGTTSNLAWATPTGWTSTEAACETKFASGGAPLTASVDGNPFIYDYVNSLGKSSTNITSDSAEFELGESLEVILWIRRLTAVGAMIVKHANLEWEEEW